MRQAHLLLQPFVDMRPVQAHEGSVMTLASNQRWPSDVLESSCWNGEVVRVAFATDTCAREIITWHASTAGISGECRVLSDGSPKRTAYTARETLEFAVALGLVACFTPVRSPDSNGVSEAFVKTLKRDYTRIQPRPDAATVLQMLPLWIDDYNQCGRSSL